MSTAPITLQITDELMASLQKLRPEQCDQLGEYLVELIRQDIRHAEDDAWFEQMHRESIESGDPVETTPAEIRDRMLARIEAIRNAKERQAG